MKEKEDEEKEDEEKEDGGDEVDVFQEEEVEEVSAEWGERLNWVDSLTIVC